MMEYVLKQTKKSSILFLSGPFEHVSLSGGQLWIVLSGNAQASMRIKGGRRYAITSQKDRSTDDELHFGEWAELRFVLWIKI